MWLARPCLYLLVAVLPFCSTRRIPNLDPKTAKPIVFVIGADGLVGRRAVSALSSMYGKALDVRAGVPNPAKAKSLKTLVGVTVVKADVGQKEKLKMIFQGVSALYIASTSRVGRAQLFIDTAEAAREAGVKHILVNSLVMAELTDTIFGKFYHEIETGVSALGVPLTVLRLSIFMDNYARFKGTIKHQSAIYGPVNPAKSYTPVAVDDAAVASAVILASPGKHAGKTYTIANDRVTFEDVAEAFTNQLGRSIRYVRISYEKTKANFMKHGFPERQAESIMEMYRLVDNGSPVINRKNLNDFSEITGRKPTNVSTWIEKHGFLFT